MREEYSECRRLCRQAYRKSPKYLQLQRFHGRQRHAKFRDWLARHKNKPCADCGNSYPAHIMDFDHVRDSKRKDVGTMTTYAESVVLLEIAKCDLVCANCHRERTHRRREFTIRGKKSAPPPADE